MSGRLPALRQIVLLTSDLPGTIAATQQFLGLNRGVREAQAMAALGFEHEVLAIDRTFVEVVAPLSDESSPGRLLAANGESGYMVVLQVDGLDALIERGAKYGLQPVMSDVLDGNPISQWHPRDLGTLAEIDEIRAGSSWHFCPALSDTGSTAVVSDIVAAEIAVTDPAATAARWAALLDIAIETGTTQIALATGRLRFVPRDGPARGLVRVEFARSATAGVPDPPAPTETSICGVRLTILEQEEQR